MRRPLACGQLCRPEVGVPWRPGSSARMAMSLPCGVIRGSSDSPPAGLRPAVPTGGRRSPAAGAICTNGGVFTLRRHPGEQRCAARWPAASCADRRSAFPGGRCHLHEWRCLCLAASSGGAAMRRPLACGQLCRPEVGVPWRPVPSARMAVSLPCGVMRGEQRCAARWPAASCADRRSAFPGGRCPPHEWRCLHPAASCRGSSDAPPAGLRPAVPGPIGRTAQRSAFQAVPALFWRGGVLPSAQKTMAANSVRCLRDRGESVKGGPPFHKSTMTNRNSPPRAAGAQGSFDCRREAPGGPRTGPQLQAELRPKAIPDQGPVRGPLDPDCRSETGAPLSRAVPRIGGRRYPPGRPSPAGGRISPLWRFERPNFSWVGDCSWSHWPGS